MQRQFSLRRLRKINQGWTRPRWLADKWKGIKPMKSNKWNIVRGDTVEIISGKDAGKRGKVKYVARAKNKVFVKKCRMRKRWFPGPSGEGGYLMLEAPVHVSQVMLIDPTTGKKTQVKNLFNEDGEKVRVAKETGAIIPRSSILRKMAKKKPNILTDTLPADVLSITYQPPDFEQTSAEDLFQKAKLSTRMMSLQRASEIAKERGVI